MCECLTVPLTLTLTLTLTVYLNGAWPPRSNRSLESSDAGDHYSYFSLLSSSFSCLPLSSDPEFIALLLRTLVHHTAAAGPSYRSYALVHLIGHHAQGQSLRPLVPAWMALRPHPTM